MAVVDTHMHPFPLLSGDCGYPTVEEHRNYLQFYLSTHSEPARRLKDHRINADADGALLEHLDDFSGLKEANFRSGPYGRFEWEWEGETYYRTFLPPSLLENSAPIEFLRLSMARAGVDVAVLQNSPLYGRLNEMFAKAASDYPDTFIGLADVVAAEAGTEAECERLRHAIEDLGLSGVYYANRGLIASNYRYGLDDEVFDPYWETLRSLGVPVFWELQGVPYPTAPTYLEQVERLNRWCDRYPDIPCLLTHGVTPEDLAGELPAPIAGILAREQVMVEILYPISWGREHEYPFAELRPALRRLYDLVGPDRLTWGSDMPNVERNCTYRQSLDYLRHGLADVASATEMDAILGGNALRLVGKSR